MSSRTQQEPDTELVENMNKILDKAFADIRKRVLTLVTRHEKKIMRMSKTVPKPKPGRPSKATLHKEEERLHRHKRSSYHRSKSSTSDTD
uniref:Uncharacterized protein n=1 Tax=viral metagenome TaxID=1070528 RepID=A0A6C0EK42_9ZZZZ